MAHSKFSSRVKEGFPHAAYWDTAGFGGGARVKELELMRGCFLAEIVYALFAAYVLMWAILIFIR